jgi:hypothetical protein
MAANGDMVTGLGRSGRHRICGEQPGLQGLPHVLLLLLALLCALPRAMAANAVDIDAVVGFSDTFQAGRWTPLNVTVTNHGGEVSGELEVQITGSDELKGRSYVTSQRRKLELHRNTRKSQQFIILPQSLSHPLVIRVLVDGRELSRAEVDLRRRFVAEQLVLVLSRDANLDYLNDGTANGRRVLYPHPELLPAHWRGYDAVAAIVVRGVSLERLSARQFDALHKWIAQGGILAVSGGPDYEQLRRPRLASLLPGLPLGMTRIDADALRSTFSASLDVSRPVYVNRLGAFRGSAPLRSVSAPLIVERTLGLGRVLYLTFDVAGPPFNRWEGMRKLWLDNLRLPPATTPVLGKTESVPESALQALVRAEAPDFPSHAMVLFFVALYLGSLWGACRFPVHETVLRRLAPIWSWAAPALFVFAAWLLFGPAMFHRGPIVAAIAVIEPFPDSIYARLELELGVYATRSGTLHLEYGGAEPVWYPLRQAQQRGNVEDWMFGEDSQRFLEPQDRRRYVLHALEGEDVIAFYLDFSVRDEINGPRVILDNVSGRRVEDLWLVFDGYAYALGSIADGVRIERAFNRRTHGVAVDAVSWRSVLRAPSSAPAQDPAPTRIALEHRAQELGEMYPGPGHALLVGYTTSPLRPVGASAGWPRRERAVVAFRVAALRSDASTGDSNE